MPVGTVHTRECMGVFRESRVYQETTLWPSRAFLGFASLQQLRQPRALCPAPAGLTRCSRSLIPIS